MPTRHCSFRPSLEVLEGRDTPANLTATFDPLTHTLAVTGDADNNPLVVQAVDGDTTRFLLSSTTDKINGVAGDFLSPSGVQNITIKLLAGDDSTTFSTVNGGVSLQHNLSILGGNGANAVASTDLNVGGNFSITNGANTTGTDVTILLNLTVGGSLTINNGDGDTHTAVARDSTGLSFIRGNVTMTNGKGNDDTLFSDTNVGGGVTVSNGLPNASNVAGNTRIFNSFNTTARSVIGGNVSVSYLAGNTAIRDGIWDMHVLGNVSFTHGSGSFVSFLDGLATSLPVKINGSLTMSGTGANQIFAGTGMASSGLVVGGTFTVTGGPANDDVASYKLAVGGATLLSLGKGSNNVTIDDSEFGGSFTLNTGTGADTVNLDTTAGTTLATTFAKNVLMNLGDGVDTVVRAGSADANQRIVFYKSFVIHHGPGADVDTPNLAQEISPFGSLIQWLI